MKFIKEFFNGKLKCKRVGHNYKTNAVIIRRRSTYPGSICVDYKADMVVCTRCEDILEPTIEIEWERHSSVEMPQEYWNEMDKKGYILV